MHYDLVRFTPFLSADVGTVGFKCSHYSNVFFFFFKSQSKAQECPDGDAERLTRRSPWYVSVSWNSWNQIYSEGKFVCERDTQCVCVEWVGEGSLLAVPTTRGLLLLLLCPSVITVVFRNAAGKSSARPPLKRFVSSAAWVDTEEPSVMMKG